MKSVWQQDCTNLGVVILIISANFISEKHMIHKFVKAILEIVKAIALALPIAFEIVEDSSKPTTPTTKTLRKKSLTFLNGLLNLPN